MLITGIAHLRNGCRTLLTGFLLLQIPGLALCAPDAKSGPDVRILWTNDTHGYLSPLYHREEGDNRFVERAQREGRVGGFAYIATVLNRQRDEYPDRTLLFDSDDTWHSTVVPVRLGGAPVVEVMNDMNYDAMVPGNVDFFYDQDTLKQLFKHASFPILIANLYDAQWNECPELPNVRSYIIKQVGDLKIAIIGMTYHWISKIADHPQWNFGLRTREIQQDIDYSRNKANVDLVVLLSHMGWKVDAKYAELVHGIDLIIGAHTHDVLYRPTVIRNQTSRRDVLIVQCGSHGKMLGQLDLQLLDNKHVAYRQVLFPICARDLKPDPRIETLIRKLRAPFKAELERVIGNTRSTLYRQGTWQSTADNLISDALRARTRQDIAMSEPGRYGAAVLPRPITVEDIYNLVPAEATIYHMKFSGKQIWRMLENAVDNVVADEDLRRVGSYMWRFSGLELVLDLTRPYPNRIQRITVGGKTIDETTLYTLAEFNMFLRNNPEAIDVQKTDRIGPHEVIAYIEEKQILNLELDQRITDHHHGVLGDRLDLDEFREQTGFNNVDPENTKIYIHQGVLNNE